MNNAILPVMRIPVWPSKNENKTISYPFPFKECLYNKGCS